MEGKRLSPTSLTLHIHVHVHTHTPVCLAPLDVAHSMIMGEQAVKRVELEGAIGLADSLQQGLGGEVPQGYSAWREETLSVGPGLQTEIKPLSPSPHSTGPSLLTIIEASCQLIVRLGRHPCQGEALPTFRRAPCLDGTHLQGGHTLHLKRKRCSHQRKQDNCGGGGE